MNYIPWQGDEYCRSAPKLLIIGHSHYSSGFENPENACDPLLTGNVIAKHISGEGKETPYRFFSYIEQVVSGRNLTQNERTAFWTRVAFSNYLQEPLVNPGDRPSRAQWERAHSSFPTLLDLTKPALIFVFSLEVWRLLPSEDAFPGSENVTRLTDAAYLWRLSDRVTLGGGFAHPRNPRVDRDIWHAWAEWLQTEARRRGLGGTG